MRKNEQLPKTSPDDLKKFDVVRVRQNDKNVTAVVMNSLYVPDSNKVSSLIVYLISPEHNPSDETRLAAKSQRDEFYYVSSETFKAKMGLDVRKDYRIALNINGLFMTPDITITRLGSLAITSITNVLVEKFSNQVKALQSEEKQKEVLDAATRKRLQGPSTFDYDSITSPNATSWAIANSAAPDKRLNAPKLKSKKTPEPAEEQKPVKPGSLFDLYTQHVGLNGSTGVEEVLVLPAPPAPVQPEEPALIQVATEEAPESASAETEQDIYTDPPDVSLALLFEKGMISNATQNAFARNSEKGLEPVRTLVQAFNFLMHTSASQIPGISTRAANTTEYEIRSVVEDLGLKL